MVKSSLVLQIWTDGGYFTNGWLERNFVVKGVSSGKLHTNVLVTKLKKLVKMKLTRRYGL